MFNIVIGGLSRFVFMEEIATKNKKILVKVVYVQEKFQTNLQMDPALKIKDIYPKIAVKVKVSPNITSSFNIIRESVIDIIPSVYLDKTNKE